MSSGTGWHGDYFRAEQLVRTVLDVVTVGLAGCARFVPRAVAEVGAKKLIDGPLLCLRTSGLGL